MGSLASINIRFVADLAQFSTQIQNANRKIKKMGRDMTRTGQKISMGITAPVTALGAAAVSAFSNLEGVQIAFERLDSPNLLKNLQEATKGTVSNLELMKAAVQAKNFKIPLTELSTLLEFARRRAKDTGQSVDFLVDSIVTGIGRKSPLILDNLGISASELKDNLNGVAAASSSIADVTKAVGKIARNELTKMGADAFTAKEGFQQIKAEVSNLLAEFGQIIAQGITPFVGGLKNLVQSFKALTPETKKFIVVLSGIAAASGPLLVIAGTVLPAISAGFVALTGPIGLAVAALAAVAVVIAKNWEPIKKLLVSIANYFVDLYNESTAFRISVEAIALSFKNMFAVVKTIFESIYKIITAVIKQLALQFESFGTVIKGALTLDTSLIKKAVTDLVSSTKNNFSETISSIGQNFNSTFNEVSENLKTALDNSLKKTKYVLPVTLEVKNTVNKTNAVSSSAARPLRARVSSVLTGIQPVGLEPLVINLKEPEADLTATLTRMGQNFTEFSVLVSQSIRDAAVNVITGFGEMIGGLITGEASIQDFASRFIGILGDLAIQLGQIAIQIGVAMAAIKNSFKVPGAAIAAGIALIALGKIIKSASGVFSDRDAGGFTEGGVVGGSSFFGDRLFARVNSGELILNQGQQRNLNNMLDYQASKNLNLSLVVEGEITGQNLALALKRYKITESRIK